MLKTVDMRRCRFFLHIGGYNCGKQTHDESTQEMQLSDEILKRGYVSTQKELFAHPFSQFGSATRTGAYVFCLRALANYPHNVRITALNLGPKVVELAWTKKFTEAFPDRSIEALFSSQLPETRSRRYRLTAFWELPMAGGVGYA